MNEKTCSKCNKDKSLCDFPKNKTKKDGLSYQCKECSRSNIRKHYQENKQYYFDKSNVNKKESIDWFRKFKSELICYICGEDHVACIDFHHEDSTKKEINISKAVNNGWSIESLKKEIEKCTVVCSNCHRKLHYEERSGPFKNLPDECDGSTQLFESCRRGSNPRLGT